MDFCSLTCAVWNTEHKPHKLGLKKKKKTAHTELLQQPQLHKNYVLLAKTKKDLSEKKDS